MLALASFISSFRCQRSLWSLCKNFSKSKVFDASNWVAEHGKSFSPTLESESTTHPTFVVSLFFLIKSFLLLSLDSSCLLLLFHYILRFLDCFIFRRTSHIAEEFSFFAILFSSFVRCVSLSHSLPLSTSLPTSSLPSFASSFAPKTSRLDSTLACVLFLRYWFMPWRNFAFICCFVFFLQTFLLFQFNFLLPSSPSAKCEHSLFALRLFYERKWVSKSERAPL